MYIYCVIILLYRGGENSNQIRWLCVTTKEGEVRIFDFSAYVTNVTSNFSNEQGANFATGSE